MGHSKEIKLFGTRLSHDKKKKWGRKMRKIFNAKDYSAIFDVEEESFINDLK